MNLRILNNDDLAREAVSVSSDLDSAVASIDAGMTRLTRTLVINWLTGQHAGWRGLYGDVPAWLRDRMARAAGDLALEHYVPDAREALVSAADCMLALSGQGDV